MGKSAIRIRQSSVWGSAGLSETIEAGDPKVLTSGADPERNHVETYRCFDMYRESNGSEREMEGRESSNSASFVHKMKCR